VNPIQELWSRGCAGLIALCCLVLICGSSMSASADDDYFEALASARSAEKTRKFKEAAQALQAALHKYPNDYTLTLTLAWMEFRAKHYAEAERIYRIAIKLSNGALDARIGLGWALVQQERCEEGVKIFEEVLDEQPHNALAKNGMLICARRGPPRSKPSRSARRRPSSGSQQSKQHAHGAAGAAASTASHD
jgi:tetratricopeptide (TPR) repeat protein